MGRLDERFSAHGLEERADANDVSPPTAHLARELASELAALERALGRLLP